MKRRILSTLMALVLCLTLLPAAAYADGARRSMSAAAAMMGPVTARRTSPTPRWPRRSQRQRTAQRSMS